MNNKKNILVLSKFPSDKGKEVWTVIEYKHLKKFKDAESFQWVPNGRNMTFNSRGDAILTMSVEAAELYEFNKKHQLHMFKANVFNDLVKIV